MYECERGFLTRNPHPLDGCGRRLWSGLRRVVGDVDHGCSARVPPRGTWHLRWHMRLTCRDAFPARSWTANPGEKTSLHYRISRQHLPYYLDEFTFRFNRRTSKARGMLFYRLLQQAVDTDPHPLKELIGG